MVLSSNHPFLDGIFPNKNHPAIRVPPWLWNPKKHNRHPWPVCPLAFLRQDLHVHHIPQRGHQDAGLATDASDDFVHLVALIEAILRGAICGAWGMANPTVLRSSDHAGSSEISKQFSWLSFLRKKNKNRQCRSPNTRGTKK